MLSHLYHFYYFKIEIIDSYLNLTKYIRKFYKEIIDSFQINTHAPVVGFKRFRPFKTTTSTIASNRAVTKQTKTNHTYAPVVEWYNWALPSQYSFIDAKTLRLGFDSRSVHPLIMRYSKGTKIIIN